MTQTWSNPPVGRPVIVPGSAQAVQRAADAAAPHVKALVDAPWPIDLTDEQVREIADAVDWNPVVDTRGMARMPKDAYDARKAAITRSVLAAARRVLGGAA